MHNFVQIDDKPGLVRDMSSHAVISTNPEKVNDYFARKAAAVQKDKQLRDQQNEINELKTDIEEIKTMLRALMQR
jgi:hypothetical protein